jgi:hypothetical protein
MIYQILSLCTFPFACLLKQITDVRGEQAQVHLTLFQLSLSRIFSLQGLLHSSISILDSIFLAPPVLGRLAAP